jgi:hypothetical protein
MYKRIQVVAFFALIMSGCAMNPSNKTLIVLQHPGTKETRECRADAWTTWNVYAEVEACAKAYEKAGFNRLGSY